jgi:LCP family protein required for cell wall assembly
MEKPPRPGLGVIKRAVIAAVLIVLMTAGAVSAAVFLQIDDVVTDFNTAGGKNSITLPDVTPAEAGKPQTIMILGTDARLGADATPGERPRSDTIILARLDAHKSAISLMSIPRDLKVTIPGYQLPDKINAAYSNGGANLTLKTVKQLLSQPGKPFKINHVIQVSFTGFRRMVDYLGCTYIDIDRRYFNDIGGPGGYATIDIQPGYQKLCGKDALDYVRYRHTDNDLIRGARQQDFIRQMLRQPGVRQRLGFSARRQLARIAGRYTRTDKSLSKSRKALLSLLKLGLGVAAKPVQEVPFGNGQIADDGSYLTASQAAIDATVAQFMNPHTSVSVTSTSPSSSSSKASTRKRKHKASKQVSGLASAANDGDHGRPAPRLPVLLPQADRQHLPLHGLAAAAVPDPRPRGAQARRLPDGARVRARSRRPVLRRPGHDLEGPADPRRAARHRYAQPPQAARLLRRAQGPPCRLADPQRRVLGAQHAQPHDPVQPHGRDRGVADAPRRPLNRGCGRRRPSSLSGLNERT